MSTTIITLAAAAMTAAIAPQPTPATAAASGTEPVVLAQLLRRDRLPDITAPAPVQPAEAEAVAPAAAAAVPPPPSTGRLLPGGESGGLALEGGRPAPVRGAPRPALDGALATPATRPLTEAERPLADPATIVRRPLAAQVLTELPIEYEPGSGAAPRVGP